MDKKLKMVLAALLLALVFLALVVWALYALAMSLEQWKLAAWAIVATLLVPGGFALGFWFGKVEVRGWLAGVDASLDKLAKVVDLRDNTRFTYHGKVAAQEDQQRVVVVPTAYPQISQRVSDSKEVIDL